MKADALKFFVSYFWMSKIDFAFWSSLTKELQNGIFGIFDPGYINPKSIFRFSKIAEKKLWSVSFHNHLVARCNIENRWSGAVLNTTLHSGEKPLPQSVVTTLNVFGDVKNRG